VPPSDVPSHAIEVNLTPMLEARGMSLAALAAQAGVTYVNLSILKNNRAKAIRFSTLSRLCEVLECQPGDLLAYEPKPSPAPDG